MLLPEHRSWREVRCTIRFPTVGTARLRRESRAVRCALSARRPSIARDCGTLLSGQRRRRLLFCCRDIALERKFGQQRLWRVRKNVSRHLMQFDRYVDFARRFERLTVFPGRVRFSRQEAEGSVTGRISRVAWCDDPSSPNLIENINICIGLQPDDEHAFVVRHPCFNHPRTYFCSMCRHR